MSHEKINHQHSKKWSKHVELTKAPVVPGPATVGILQRQKHMGLAACRHPIFGQHMICSIGWFFIFNHCRIGWRMQYSTLAGNPSRSQMTSSPSHLKFTIKVPPKNTDSPGLKKHAQKTNSLKTRVSLFLFFDKPHQTWLSPASKILDPHGVEQGGWPSVLIKPMLTWRSSLLSWLFHRMNYPSRIARIGYIG